MSPKSLEKNKIIDDEQEGGQTGEGPPADPNRALVIHPARRADRNSHRQPQARLAEAVSLAKAIHLDVVHSEVVAVNAPRPATLMGKGAVESLGDIIAAAGVAVVVVDGPLSPVQQRNLERAWDCKVIDRTGLILEIFGERARTREGRLQVELARLTFQRSRLVRSWTHLERQRGGFGFMGGPGETQIEADRRLIGDRIAKLKLALEDVKRTRHLHRRARRKVPYPIVALVGYTNAGKSTLFNRLSRAEVLVKDQLFATLDPTMRAIVLPSGRSIILSDTVGFVSDLPHDLVAAFRATLEEVLEADLLIHVRDISQPDNEAQKEDVHTVLRELGLGAIVEEGLVEVLNKIDLLDPERREVVTAQAARDSRQSLASAVTGEGCEDLLALLDARLAAGLPIQHYAIPLEDGATIAWLYAHGEVLERHDDDSHARLNVRLSAADAARLESRLA